MFRHLLVSARAAGAVRRVSYGFATFVLVQSLAMGNLQSQEELPLPPSVLVPNQAQQDPLEELARGPIHEAFAEQVSYDAIPGIIVPREPPPAVPELPPEYKPEGDGYVFISGYWFWDVTREDFIWVSGGYRQLPPDTVWIDGYWHQVEGGWQRVSGFYSLADSPSVSYYRTPPSSLENGPIGPAPSPDHMWSPGYWAPYEGEFVWRPGYWQVVRPDWVWVPRYWRWTPRGCILVGGYWDYPWDARGYCFAPVYFHQPIYLDPGWCYRPRIVLRNLAVQFHWFVRPLDCHYYFGDWYDAAYYQRGFIPGFQFHARTRGIGFDPCFAYNQWSYGRQGLDYFAVSVQWNRHFVNHVDLRPPRTFIVQNNVIQNINNVTINNTTINNTIINQTVLADTIHNAANQRGNRTGWRQLESTELDQLAQSVERSRHTQRERAQAESAATRLTSLRAANADANTIQQLEQLSREQQTAAREARQRASDQINRRLSTDSTTTAGPRSGWGQNPNQPQRSDRELVNRLERQLPQVAIGEQNREQASGRPRSNNQNGSGRTIALDPPRATGRLGINTPQNDDEGQGRGTGWRSPTDLAAPSARPQNLSIGRGLTPLPEIDRSELERRAKNRGGNVAGNPTIELPPVVRGQSRENNSGAVIDPRRNAGNVTGNHANPNAGRVDRSAPPSNPPMDDTQRGRGAGWQERNNRGGGENPPSIPQPQLRLPNQSNNNPQPQPRPTQPRVNTQPQVAPNTPALPSIDRSELERRAANRNQNVEVNPRSGWNQPRAESPRQAQSVAPPNRSTIEINPVQPRQGGRQVEQPPRANRSQQLNVPEQSAPRNPPRETPQPRVQPERSAPQVRAQPPATPPRSAAPQRQSNPPAGQSERSSRAGWNPRNK